MLLICQKRTREADSRSCARTAQLEAELAGRLGLKHNGLERQRL
jgi:hypothetical protein